MYTFYQVLLISHFTKFLDVIKKSHQMLNLHHLNCVCTFHDFHIHNVQNWYISLYLFMKRHMIRFAKFDHCIKVTEGVGSSIGIKRVFALCTAAPLTAPRGHPSASHSLMGTTHAHLRALELLQMLRSTTRRAVCSLSAVSGAPKAR